MKEKCSQKNERRSANGNGTGDDDDIISIDSADEALCDVLGLPSLDGMVMEEDEESAEEVESPVMPFHQNPMRIELPLSTGVSRKYYDPRDCVAYEIPNVLTADECLELISIASNSSSTNAGHDASSSDTKVSSFRYITHAVHTAPDGKTKFQVQLEKPNPHKLAVFRHELWVKRLWKRLEPWVTRPSDDTCTEHHELWKALRKFVRRESLVGPPVGLNPRLRVLKYDASDKDEFQAHFDATTEIHHSLPPQTSYLTVLLYLNDGGGIEFDGGETEFLSQHDATVHTSESSIKISPKAGSIVLFEHDLFHRGRPLEWGTKYVLRTDVMFANRTELPKENGSTIIKEPMQSPPAQDVGKGLCTVEDILCRMEENLSSEGNHDDSTTLLEFLRSALSDGLGFGRDLHDTSIGCLCSPGRFPLNLMLHEHIVASQKAAVLATRLHHQPMLDRFLDLAFAALKESN